MRPLTIGEIETLAAQLRSLAGARLQKVYSSPKDLVMEFYGAGREFWLWWDLNPAQPMVVLLHTKPRALPKIKKPLALFLHSHGVNRHLVRAERPEALGRLLRIYLGGAESELQECCLIEGRLFPHGQNLLARDGDKEVWWKKPQPLPESIFEEEIDPGRSPQELADQWLGARSEVAGKRVAPDQEKKLKRELARLERAVTKVKQDLGKNREKTWRQLGEWLSANQSLEVPSQWQTLVDSKESFAWNLERCFKKAKDLEAKRSGTEERLSQLEGELAVLRKDGVQALSSKSGGVAPMKRGGKLDAKTRKLELDGKFEAYVGRSAKDNLNLLRQARAWDLWLHLRDYPGSHCIIRRNKNEAVPEAALERAAQWVAKATFGRKAEQKQGEKLTVLYAECRHVQPIKGDKMGRVTFRNESTITISFSP